MFWIILITISAVATIFFVSGLILTHTSDTVYHSSFGDFMDFNAVPGIIIAALSMLLWGFGLFAVHLEETKTMNLYKDDPTNHVAIYEMQELQHKTEKMGFFCLHKDEILSINIGGQE